MHPGFRHLYFLFKQVNTNGLKWSKINVLFFWLTTVVFLKALARFLSTTKELNNKMPKKNQAASMSDDVNQV